MSELRETMVEFACESLTIANKDIKQAMGQGFGPKQATAIVIREFNKQIIVKFFFI